MIGGDKMKMLAIQKQGMSIDKNTGTVSRFGFSICCFEDAGVPRKVKFKNKKENKIIEDQYEDFFDEDSEE